MAKISFAATVSWALHQTLVVSARTVYQNRWMKCRIHRDLGPKRVRKLSRPDA